MALSSSPRSKASGWGCYGGRQRVLPHLLRAPGTQDATGCPCVTVTRHWCPFAWCYPLRGTAVSATRAAARTACALEGCTVRVPAVLSFLLPVDAPRAPQVAAPAAPHGRPRRSPGSRLAQRWPLQPLRSEPTNRRLLSLRLCQIINQSLAENSAKLLLGGTEQGLRQGDPSLALPALCRPVGGRRGAAPSSPKHLTLNPNGRSRRPCDVTNVLLRVPRLPPAHPA